MHTATQSTPEDYTVDVHCHPIPSFFREALIAAGHKTVSIRGQTVVIVDGFPTPPWDLESFLKNRDEFGLHFSIMSITAPGVNFLSGAPAANLARRLNDQMAEWVAQHPTRLGAFGCIPVSDIDVALKEIAYCLDVLHFEGIGLFTNYNGVYLGDPSLHPIMEELNRRKVGVLVHPVQPSPEPNFVNLPAPGIEYPFDTTRAITNMVLQGTRTKFPDVNLIFSHGGGTIPFLGHRIGGVSMASQLAVGGKKNPQMIVDEIKGFHYDLACSTNEPQLAGLKAFVSTDHLLVGSDFPYFPAAALQSTLDELYNYPGFSKEDLKKIRHGNAFALFPRILEKLEKHSGKK